jgi:hypothetical protein
MSYQQGKYICDSCGREIDVNIFTSRPIYVLKELGWVYWNEEIIHTEPERMIRSEFTDGRLIKTRKKVENVLRMKCDVCILIGERVEKIQKIKEKLGS